TLALPQNRPPRDFRGMRCEYRNHANPPQGLNRVLQRDARVSDSQQCSFERAGLRRFIRRTLQRAAAPFAMIGFSEVRQLEINGKRFRKLGRFAYGDTPNDVAPRVERGLTGAAGDRKRPERFHSIEEVLALLLLDDSSEQPAQRTDIAP